MEDRALERPWQGGRPPLVRSADDRWIAGVCGGIARTLGMSSTVVRIVYVLVSVLLVAFPGILFYVILWALMPSERRVGPAYT
jgi:phage shock protein PspC (stress-responsive transcriptional regulator)